MLWVFSARVAQAYCGDYVILVGTPQGREIRVKASPDARNLASHSSQQTPCRGPNCQSRTRPRHAPIPVAPVHTQPSPRGIFLPATDDADRMSSMALQHGEESLLAALDVSSSIFHPPRATR